MAGSTGETIDLTGIMVEAGLQPADYLVVAPVVIPILFGALHLMLRNRPVKHGVLAIIGMGLLVVCTFGLLQRVLDTGPVTMTMGRWLPPFGISFSVDTAGALLAFTSAVIALGGAVYAKRSQPAE